MKQELLIKMQLVLLLKGNAFIALASLRSLFCKPQVPCTYMLVLNLENKTKQNIYLFSTGVIWSFG